MYLYAIPMSAEKILWLNRSAYDIELYTKTLKNKLFINSDFLWRMSLFYYIIYFLSLEFSVLSILLCSFGKFHIILLYKHRFTVSAYKKLHLETCSCSFHQFAHEYTPHTCIHLICHDCSSQIWLFGTDLNQVGTWLQGSRKC